LSEHISWEEAHEAYKEDLRNQFDIGYALGKEVEQDRIVTILEMTTSIINPDHKEGLIALIKENLND
jgi:hypothetical protein